MAEVDIETLKQIPNTQEVDWNKPVIWTGNQGFKVNVIADLYSRSDHKIINISGYGKIHHMVVDEFGFPSLINQSPLQRIVNIPEEPKNILLIAEYRGNSGYTLPHKYPMSRFEVDDFKSKHIHFKSFREIII